MNGRTSNEALVGVRVVYVVASLTFIIGPISENT